MTVIQAQQLGKDFRVADKQPGLRGTLKHLFNRQHRTIRAVDGVTFSIEPGEVVGFLGPNGAGKTTTLKMLSGLIKPSAGGTTVLGQEPFDRKASFLRQITLVMGNKQQLIWDLPTLDSLRINAAIYGIPDTEAKRRTDTLADMLDLGDELTQPVRKLSLGQRMKCELLAALLHHPTLLFLDEPTLGLDVNAQAAVRRFLKAYNKEHGATILLTSHYMADITALCQRVIVVHEGRLLHDGTLQQVIDRFAPFREVRIDLTKPVDASSLATFGEVEAVDGQQATLLVERERLTGVINTLLNDWPVSDLSVTDPSVEEVIRKLFAHGNGENQSPGDEP